MYVLCNYMHICICIYTYSMFIMYTHTRGNSIVGRPIQRGCCIEACPSIMVQSRLGRRPSFRNPPSGSSLQNT